MDRLDPEVLFVPGSRLPHIKVPWAEERRARAGEGGAGLRMPPAGLQSQLSCHWLGDPTNHFLIVMGTLTSHRGSCGTRGGGHKALSGELGTRGQPLLLEDFPWEELALDIQ